MAPRRPARRLGLAIAAMGLAGGTGGWLALRHPSLAALTGTAIVLLAAGLCLRRGGMIALSGALLGGGLTIGAVGRPVQLGASTIAAVAFLAILELAFASIQLAPPVRWDTSARQRAAPALLMLGAGAVAALTVGIAGVVGYHGGPLVFGLGALLTFATLLAVVRIEAGGSER